MNRTELESKRLSELHTLAAEAGVPRYRMLPRAELIEKLADGKPTPEKRERKRAPREERRPAKEERRPAREERSARGERPAGGERPARGERRPAREKPPAREERPPQPAAPSAEPSRPPRRRRRFGRKPKGLRVNDLLLPPPGRQALVYADGHEACTSLLREIAAELAGESKGPDPIALLIDPSPEELAEWKREAPDAEIVAAGKSRHATDALAQASRRAESGEDVILLVDSLSKLEDSDVAKEIFDGGLNLSSAQGSLTVVAALERPA